VTTGSARRQHGGCLAAAAIHLLFGEDRTMNSGQGGRRNAGNPTGFLTGIPAALPDTSTPPSIC
jgi:hypothetical protein